jgi:hypothetical protein
MTQSTADEALATLAAMKLARTAAAGQDAAFELLSALLDKGPDVDPWGNEGAIKLAELLRDDERISVRVDI